MGMLINGVWREQDRLTHRGAFVRRPGAFAGAIDQGVVEAMAAEPGRFCLIGSWSCPWSHRTMLIRQLKGLQAVLPLHMTGGERVEGYPANFGKPWRVPGGERTIRHLHQLYTLSDPAVTGRSTVPVLWDSQQQRIVSNESAAIARALDAVASPGAEFTLAPAGLALEMAELNDAIYRDLSNGVYRAGFARSQSAYDEAVTAVFSMLEALEQRLADRRYLLGAVVTEVDWRLFATLVRFDLDYVPHSGCGRRRLVEYPHLWDYARDLYSWQGGRANREL